MLRQLIGERGADSAWLTASLFNTLVDLDPDCLGGLRQLLTGGDILPVPHVRRALLRHPRLHLVNGYGPTENTTFTCCHVVTDDDLEEDDIPIGKAIAGTAVLLLDEHGQEIAEPDRAGRSSPSAPAWRRVIGTMRRAPAPASSSCPIAAASCVPTVPATALATTSRAGCASSAAAMARSS